VGRTTISIEDIPALKWVDLLDFTQLSSTQRSAAKLDILHTIFDDLLVDRPTHVAACIRGYLSAERLSLRYVPELTERQEEAVRVRSEALQLGRRDIQVYISEKMGISQPAVSMLLQRADEVLEAKMLYSAPIFGENIEQGDQLPPAEEARVQAWMLSHPRRCAGYGRPEVKLNGRIIPECKGHAPMNRALCWDCRQVYGTRDSWGEREQWLDFLVRDIAREHRQNAIEAIRRQPQVIEFPEVRATRRREALAKLA
jgi:hypothetical protein